MRHWFALALAACLAAPVQAQDWATREVCFVDAPVIHEAALAPASLAQLEAEARLVPNGQGRYWRITSASGAVSHLWGTMHSNDPMILDLPDRVERDIRRARAVAVEIDFVFRSRADYARFAKAEDIIGPYSATPQIARLALPDHIEQWIRARTEGVGWGADAPDYLTLAGLAQMVLSDPCDDFASGIYPGQDGLIQMLGAIEGTRIIGLEPPDAFLIKLGDPANFKLARALIATYGAYLNPARTRQSTATAYAIYLQGRTALAMAWDRSYVASIYGADEADAMLALTNGYLVGERNRNFLDRARPELEQGGVVMAIGNFHLPGKEGMVELLRAEGFTVERVTLPGEVGR